MKDTRMNGDDFYDKWHEAGDEALGVLQDEFSIPPSAEVFEHSLEVLRSLAAIPIDVVTHAWFIADEHHRVHGA